MKNILLLSTVLVCACAFPNYEKRIDNSYPPDYKNVEILLLESAVNQDGGYSFSFENDDGSKVSQEGQQKMIDDEQAVERIRGSYSYNDVNGQPVSLTYTADENGFRPVGAHLPTPPPIPVEILRSLKYLATAKPFVDEQLYDYKPKKKVFRGRQYKTGNVVQRSRNHLRLNSFPEPLADETPGEVLLKSAEDNPDTSVDNTSDTVPEMSSENPSETSPESVQTSSSGGKKPTAESVISIVNEAKKKINDAAKETIQKTSQINKSSKETSDASIAAIRGEVQKLNDNVKSQVNKINEKISGSKTKIEEQVSGSAKQSRDVIEEYTGIVSDIVSAADEVLVDVAPTEGIASDIVSAAEAADEVLVDIAPTEGIGSDIVSAADQVLADVTVAEGIASDIVSAADEVLADIATTEGISSDIVSAADEVLADIATTEGISSDIVSAADEVLADITATEETQ